VPEGHHDDQRLRLARRDQVVEDGLGMAGAGPAVIAVAGAVAPFTTKL
jgi:hypothetical protein